MKMTLYKRASCVQPAAAWCSGDRCKPSLGAGAPGILPSEPRLNTKLPLDFLNWSGRQLLKNVPLVFRSTLLVMSVLWFLPAQAAEMPSATADFTRGPHRGRLLEDGGFTVELAIFEDGVPPEYHAWATLDDTVLAPNAWQLSVTLRRLGGRVDEFTFKPQDDYLLGSRTVEEPHSFDVRVEARYQGQVHRWEFPSYEGRVELTPALSQELQLGTAVAGAGVLHQSLLLYGHIVPDPQGISHVTARYPGLIRSISAELGQRVERGQALAVIEANSSLQTYTITAPMAGLVIQRHANAGEVAGDASLLTIADYRRVWADLAVFPGDARTIAAGQRVHLRMGDLSADSDILYLNPGAGDSPSVIARVPLDNASGVWTPGLLVEADVAVAEIPVPLLIDNRALQRFRDWQVVFIKVGDTYEIRPLELGRSDGYFSEVLGGLNAGDAYVVENSYLLKADLEKSGASHDH
jgi:membrane fusion protein, heavy metal efflux system